MGRAAAAQNLFPKSNHITFRTSTLRRRKGAVAYSDNRSARSTLFHAKARLRAAVVIDFLVALKNELVAPLGESGTS